MAADSPQPEMPRRPSALAGRLAVLLLAGWLLMLLHAASLRHRDGPRLEAARQVVRAGDLTDLAWFTEARYTRHPGLADLHSAFQDGPGAPEHFPSGALVPAARRFPTAGLRLAPPAADAAR